MDLICFGDSLTFGSIGHSYIKYLKKETNYNIINKGVNGDTTSHMYSRLKKYIEKNTTNDNTYIICIGTNDLLLPYLSSISPFWEMQMKPRIKAMDCIKDDNSFEEIYKKIINIVLSNNQNLIVLGLPYLELENYPNKRIDERNKIIKNVCDEFNIAFVDISKIQKEISSYSWKTNSYLRLFEGAFLPLFPKLRDHLSKKRNLNFTVDGIHWNSAFAKEITKTMCNIKEIK